MGLETMLTALGPNAIRALTSFGTTFIVLFGMTNDITPSTSSMLALQADITIGRNSFLHVRFRYDFTVR